jgi:glutaredoxin
MFILEDAKKKKREMYPLPDYTTITVFGKKGCLYCKKAQDWLTERGETFVYIDCTEYTIHKKKFFQHINNIEGMTRTIYTFPIIFRQETFIGGYTDLVASEQLSEQLSEQPALGTIL